MKKKTTPERLPPVAELTMAELEQLYKRESLPRYSEATDIQIRFDQAVDAEYRASGKRPTVAILGAHDYEALRGFVMAFLAQYGVEMKPEEKTAQHRFEFKGVRVFKSHSMTTGIVMGGDEP